MKELLDCHRYSLAEQQAFSTLTGDYNPLHLDRTIARRELPGDVVVHGLHAVVRALDAYARHAAGRGGGALHPANVSVHFDAAIYLDQSARTHLVSEEDGVSSMEVSGPLGRLCRVEVRWREDAPSFEAVSVSGPPPGFKQVSPTQLDFEEASHQQGELQPFLEASMAASMFPHIGRVLPGPVLAELLGLSRLVGMNCPGLRSIFAALEVEFDGYGSGAALIRYRVGSCDVRFSSLNIEVRGRCLRGTVLAIVRPLPQKQASMAEVVGQVRAGEFAGQCALVIGGSRGLGEVATKIIAAGGGRPIITYHRGVDDAERVAAEVRRAGAKCTVAQCDVGRPAKAMSGLHQQGLNPTHIYFFASSKILPNRTNEFKRTLYKKFSESYVEGLSNSYRAARRQWRGPLAMFYPSTVFIDERPIGFAEYIAAKAAGEALCGYLEQTDVKLRILVKRLPRLATDQTGSSLARKEQDPLEVMREVVGGMHALGPAGDAT